MSKNIENLADMQRMQQEAVRRVHEMQRRAKQTLINCEKHNKQHQEKSTDEVSYVSTEQKVIPPHVEEKKGIVSRSKKGKNQPTFNLFSILGKEPEKGLILLLILLLLDENADISLVFALMYLLM